jgi:Icc-related predicted phosphoesterase
VPDGDVAICCGDITTIGQLTVIDDFAQWMRSLPHKHKIAIFGNHDRFQTQSYLRDAALGYLADNGITYLEDNEIVIDGIKFYGSPWTPVYGEHSFMASRGEEIASKWHRISDDVNVLITHGPPYGILDGVPKGFWFGEEIIENAGCEMLVRRIQQLKNLKAHCFGHIHTGAGVKVIDNVVFANCASCGIVNDEYEIVNPVRVIDI